MLRTNFAYPSVVCVYTKNYKRVLKSGPTGSLCRISISQQKELILIKDFTMVSVNLAATIDHPKRQQNGK